MPENDERGRAEPRESLTGKLILFVFVSCFAVALVVSWISIRSTHAALRRSFDRSYPEALARAGERARAWLAEGRETLEALGERGLVPAPRGRGPVALERALATALEESEHFAALAVVAADGSPVATAGAAHGLVDAARGLPAERGGIRQVPRASDGRALALAAAPLDGGSELLGLYRHEALLALLARERPESVPELLLVDAEGVSVASGGARRSVPLARLRADGGHGLREYTGAGGAHVIGCAVPLGLLGWHLAIEAPFDVAFAPVRSAAARIFAIDLFVILLFSYLAYKATSAIVRPIETLSERARRIADGQLDAEIPEPSSHDEIGLLTRTLNDMLRKLRRDQVEIQAANRRLLERNEELRRANEMLNQLSITDGLTKLHNHRFFQDHLTREIKRVSRVDEPLSMLLVDIDDFKSLNDRYGHAAGDEVLVGIARIMNASVRESDLLARYGGEEFVVLMPDTDAAGAYQLAEKVRTAISEASFIIGSTLRPTRITVSIGLALYRGNRKKFFVNADRALYAAKAQGKNCVVVESAE